MVCKAIGSVGLRVRRVQRHVNANRYRQVRGVKGSAPCRVEFRPGGCARGVQRRAGVASGAGRVVPRARPPVVGRPSAAGAAAVLRARPGSGSGAGQVAGRNARIGGVAYRSRGGVVVAVEPLGAAGGEPVGPGAGLDDVDVAGDPVDERGDAARGRGTRFAFADIGRLVRWRRGLYHASVMIWNSRSAPRGSAGRSPARSSSRRSRRPCGPQPGQLRASVRSRCSMTGSPIHDDQVCHGLRGGPSRYGTRPEHPTVVPDDGEPVVAELRHERENVTGHRALG